MRILTSILIFLSRLAYSQEVEQYPYNMGSRFDTVKLTPFHAITKVSYKFDSVTMFVDLVDFRKEFDELWATYRREHKERNDRLLSKDKDITSFSKTWFFLDSIHHIITTSLRDGDTLFLSKKSFRSANLNDLGNFFPYMIEKNKCSIVDIAGKIHLIILKQTGGWNGQGGGFGGRRFYIVGVFSYFLEAVDCYWET